MAATAAHDGETYAAFLIQGASGGSYSSRAGGGGATWGGKDEEQNNGSSHGMLFVDNVGGNHALTDLPALTVTFNSAPVQAGHIVLVGLGNASGTLAYGHLGNDGNGTNPNATLTYFGPGIGQALVQLLVIDNGGTMTGSLPQGWVVLTSGTLPGNIAWYMLAKFPSTGDGGGGGADDRLFSVGLTGNNIHWTITHFVTNSPGAGNDPYVIDEGAAAIVGSTLTFTSDIHGNFPVAPSNLTVPTVAGTAKSGQTLTATTGTWSGNPTPTLTWQWYTGDDVSIGGATASTFVVTDTQHGKTIYVKQTATNTEGSDTADSTETASVVYATPNNTVLPAITGEVKIGKVLSCSTGTWTGGGIAYTYQWKRGNSSIGGETASTYTVTSDDVGSTLKCTVTATSDGGAVAATSAATEAVKSNSQPWMLQRNNEYLYD